MAALGTLPATLAPSSVHNSPRSNAAANWPVRARLHRADVQGPSPTGPSTISPHCSPPTINGPPPTGGPSDRSTGVEAAESRALTKARASVSWYSARQRLTNKPRPVGASPSLSLRATSSTSAIPVSYDMERRFGSWDETTNSISYLELTAFGEFRAKTHQIKLSPAEPEQRARPALPNDRPVP